MLIYLQMIPSDTEKSKFEQIYDLYHRLMKYAAYRILRDDQDAEDAVHEAFISIAENISKFSAPDCHKTRAYAVVIVESKAIDILRRRKRIHTVPLEDIHIAVPRSDEESLLSECILRLPEKQRQVIWLRYYCGYRLKEIAQITGDSYAAVRKTDQRAKEALKKLYEEATGGI